MCDLNKFTVVSDASESADVPSLSQCTVLVSVPAKIRLLLDPMLSQTGDMLIGHRDENLSSVRKYIGWGAEGDHVLPHCTSPRIHMENERMRDEPENGIVVRVGECRQWGNGHWSNVRGEGEPVLILSLTRLRLWQSPTDPASCFCVLASHPSIVSRVGCLMSVGEKWEWKAKQHNYWTEMPSDCFVMDCLPTLGRRLPARSIQLLCRLDYCPTQNTCPWDMLCVTFLLWISVGYILYINPVDVTVLASVMSRRYVRSERDFM